MQQHKTQQKHACTHIYKHNLHKCMHMLSKRPVKISFCQKGGKKNPTKREDRKGRANLTSMMVTERNLSKESQPKNPNKHTQAHGVCVQSTQNDFSLCTIAGSPLNSLHRERKWRERRSPLLGSFQLLRLCTMKRTICCITAVALPSVYYWCRVYCTTHNVFLLPTQ